MLFCDVQHRRCIGRTAQLKQSQLGVTANILHQHLRQLGCWQRVCWVGGTLHSATVLPFATVDHCNPPVLTNQLERFQGWPQLENVGHMSQRDLR